METPLKGRWLKYVFKGWILDLSLFPVPSQLSVLCHVCRRWKTNSISVPWGAWSSLSVSCSPAMTWPWTSDSSSVIQAQTALWRWRLPSGYCLSHRKHRRGGERAAVVLLLGPAHGGRGQAHGWVVIAVRKAPVWGAWVILRLVGAHGEIAEASMQTCNRSSVSRLLEQAQGAHSACTRIQPTGFLSFSQESIAMWITKVFC